jgi:hypothetical protein
MPQGSPLLRITFVAMGVTLALLFVVGIAVAWRRTGVTAGQSRRASITAAVAAAAWLALTLAAAATGRLSFEGVPPTMVVLLVATFAIALGVGLSPVGKRLAVGLPLAALVGVQAFRLPLELMMHRAYTEGLMPVQMSYSGYNFDIVTGATAIVVAGALVAGRGGTRLVLAWNLLGLALLINVLVIALLSAPLPFRTFHNEPANVWVTTAPFVWLPAVMVATALLGHIVIFRALRHASGAASGGATGDVLSYRA